MHTITLPAVAAITGFGAMLPFTSKDTITPIIGEVGLTLHDDKLHLIGTDRYIVGLYPIEQAEEFTADDLAELRGSKWFIARAAAEWISKLKPKTWRFAADTYSIRIEWSTGNDGSTSVQLIQGDAQKIEQAMTFDPPVMGNYPPVGRLVRADETGLVESNTARFPLHSITDVLTAAKVVGASMPADSASLQLTHYDSKETSKPQPSRFSVGDLFGLIQPNLLLK